jgi:tetratricopeptide (TPR) repeat protein
MVCLRETAQRFGYRGKRIVTGFLTVIALLPAVPACGEPIQQQSVQGPPPASATLRGSVRDPHGHPVSAASVYLSVKTGTQTLTTRTDSEGNYHFSPLGEGVYTLRAQRAGYDDATFGPCVLGPNESKSIDLALKPAAGFTLPDGSLGTSEAEQPQFFDEPEFTVAGVTEAMNPGGHGSDTILRTTETLAKETASLSVTAVSKPPVYDSLSPSTAEEESLRKAAGHEPGDFEANRRIGVLLVEDGKAREALRYLNRASQLNPSDYDTAYELAVAYADAGQHEQARMQARTLVNRQNKSGQHQAALHHLLGDLEEKLGNPLEAVREYQRAAELDSSEPNFFDWGTDLLMHRAYEPAIEVFTKGNRLFPHSVRMLAGLGAAWYARGSYDLAAQRLCEASDLNPDDPNPYLFLGKMQSVRTTQSECLVERLGRFVRLQPENALANYYYALSLWIRHESLGSAEKLAEVESLLEKAVHLDPKFGAAYLQLGILYSERGDSAVAIAAYQKATDANPGLEEAHYRLGEAYSRAGEKLKAGAELQLYGQLSKERAEEAERERREIQQFVYTLRDRPSASH